MKDTGVINYNIFGESTQLITPSTLLCLGSKAESCHTESCRSFGLKLQQNITAMN